MTNNLLTLLLQLPVDTLNAVNAVNADVAVEVPEELNIWSLMLKGGFFMIPLLLLSVLSIYIFVERLLVVRKAGKEDKTFMDRIKDYIHDGEIDAALKLCKKTDTPAARLIAKGISRLGRPMNDVLVAIENTGNIEIAQLEKGFPWLATTAAGAPMIGFLGTVTGMVNAFYNMASAGNNADIT
ncbi:MAG: MotA/TolQ/ExbB proton channel family protein, partial [Muribaculaceae bacterium]|nr:MotA/TolQ/ExbB proton channel family protein [Muribaculaceae bacterium]